MRLGDIEVVPSLSAAEAAEALPGFERVKPCLRTSHDPA